MGDIKQMKARTKHVLLLLAVAFLTGTFCISWLGYHFFSPNSSRNRASSIHTILTWGQLAPFPESARRLTISATGNMFTRGFRASFTAPSADIERWLRQSPGTAGPPSTPYPGLRHFRIEPGGGAQGAEVTVNDSRNRVSIYVWWS